MAHQAQARRWLILSDSQIFVAALSVTICIILLLRYLRAAFFASWLAVSCIGLFTACLLLIGDMERLHNQNIAWVALHFFGFAIALNFLGYWMEKRGNVETSKPFYIISVALVLPAAVALACFGAEEWFHEKIAYDGHSLNLWLMSYAVPLFLLAWLAERFGTETQRALAWVFYLLAPVFALVPLNLLFEKRGVALFMLGDQPFRIYELLHVFVCIALILGGKYLRIGSFLLTGLSGSALWIFRMTHYHFEGKLGWPLSIALVGGLFVGLGVWHSYRMESTSGESGNEKEPDSNPLPEETITHLS